MSSQFSSISTTNTLKTDLNNVVSNGVNRVLITSDNSNTTCFIPFSKSATTGNKELFQDDTTTPLTYNPSTSTLNASLFSGTSTNATNVLTTTDDTNGNYFITFAKNFSSTPQQLFIDNLGGPLRYNPATGTLTTGVFDGNFVLPAAVNTGLTFSGTTLTLLTANQGSFNFQRFTFTGTTNTVNNLANVNLLANANLIVYLTNGGSGNLTINPFTGTGIWYTFTSPITVLPNQNAMLTINDQNYNGARRYVASVTLVYF